MVPFHNFARVGSYCVGFHLGTLVVDREQDLALLGLPLGLPLWLHSVTLTQRKLESGSDDSGWVLEVALALC